MIEQDIESYLAATGWDKMERRPVAGDASSRIYHRIAEDHADAALGEGKSIILMDCSGDPDILDRFCAIDTLLYKIGLKVPAVYCIDHTAHIAAIEDFGNARIGQLLDTGDYSNSRIPSRRDLLSLAIDALIRLHKTFDPAKHSQDDMPRYDANLLAEQAGLVSTTLIPALTGKTPSEAAQAEFIALWQEALSAAMQQEQTLLLRDYHADNLIFRPGREGLDALGVIDFQDAGLGSPYYDLVSLLQDARRDIGPDIEAAMLSRYKTAFPKLDDGRFAAAYGVIAGQRHIRILAVFTRLAFELGKPDYLRFMPRVWTQFSLAMDTTPSLAGVRNWLDAHLGAENYGRVPKPS